MMKGYDRGKRVGQINTDAERGRVVERYRLKQMVDMDRRHSGRSKRAEKIARAIEDDRKK